MLKLSVIVPVFNESSHLREVLDFMFRSPCEIEREWIFIDDGSTDSSANILEEASKAHSFIFLRNEKNYGKGSCVARGIRVASGDFVMIQDADFEYDPSEVTKYLLKPLLENKADVVYGSRFRKEGTEVRRTYHYLANRFLTILSNLLSGIYLTDMETCYKVFRADIVKSMDLKSKRFGIEVELTAYVAKLRIRLAEVPISYLPRHRSEGKKISWKDGVAALWHLVRFNLLRSEKAAFPRQPQSSPIGSSVRTLSRQG